MVSSEDFQKALELIDNSENILITTHTKPDGDACGSIVALCEVLTSLGKQPKPVLLSEVPRWYEFLFSEKAVVLGTDIKIEQLKQGVQGDIDLIIIVDTNSYSQLPALEDFLKANGKPVLIFDHHITSDGLGSVEIVDADAAATGLIIYDLFKYAQWEITLPIAMSLFVATATDTGWFQFSNTDSRVHRACAELIDLGVKPTQVYHNLYQNLSCERFKLMTVMLNTLEVHFAGRYADQHLKQEDFERTGASYMDTENLIDQCRKIASVEVAGLFVELEDEKIKCSLRSSGGIDVREIAQSFGGGGHKMASGLQVPGPIENAKKIILEEIKKRFDHIDSK